MRDKPEWTLEEWRQGWVTDAAAGERFKGDPNFMTSLARGLAVLQAFTPPYSQRSVSEIGRITGLSRAAVRRCLYTLNALGWVQCPDGRHYRLRPRVLTLGQAYLASSELAMAAQNALEKLSSRLNECCSAATLDGDAILCIARAPVSPAMPTDPGRGSRLPAYATSMGRVLLGALDNERLEAYLSRAAIVPFTDFSLTDAGALRADLQRVRRLGYAINDRQLDTGLCAIAVPVHTRRGGVAAAINVAVSASQMSAPELRERVLPQLQRTAMALSLRL